MQERHIPLSQLAPEPEPETLRARYFFYNNGVGLQKSDIHFQALHNCGNWTWADPGMGFCSFCGQPLHLAPQDVQTVLAHVHPSRRPEAIIARQPDPPGSFNNPNWQDRPLTTGPAPGKVEPGTAGV